MTKKKENEYWISKIYTQLLDLSYGGGQKNKNKNFSSSLEGFFFYVKSPPRTLVVVFRREFLYKIYIHSYFFEDRFFVVRRFNEAHNVHRGPTGSIFRPPRQRMTVDPVRDVASFPSTARNTNIPRTLPSSYTKCIFLNIAHVVFIGIFLYVIIW